jgi:hypothetical protein
MDRFSSEDVSGHLSPPTSDLLLFIVTFMPHQAVNLSAAHIFLLWNFLKNGVQLVPQMHTGGNG